MCYDLIDTIHLGLTMNIHLLKWNVAMDQDTMKDLIERNLLEFVATKTDTNSKNENNIEGFLKSGFQK